VMDEKTNFRPYIIRLAIVFLICLIFVALFNEVTFILQKDENDRAPKTLELVIPAGTADQVNTGQDVLSIPSDLVFVLGDTLEVNITNGKIKNITCGGEFGAKPYPDFMAQHGLQTIAREKEMIYEVTGIPMKGTVDWVGRHRDTPKGMVEIHDYKTGLTWPQEALNRNLQFGSYYIAAKQAGYNVHRLWWGRTKDLLRYKKGGKYGRKGDFRGPFLYEIHIQDADITMIEAMHEAAVKGIRGGIYMPSGSVGPHAYCPMCEFEHHCPKFQVGRVTSSFRDDLEYQEELQKKLLRQEAKTK